jgi:titin
MSNTVIGNYIGTNASGTEAISNGGSGVGICCDASHNTIGGSTPEERNLISGNESPGIQIFGTNTRYNTVSGNYIGTDVNGTAALPNNNYGVQLGIGASSNVIGGSNATPDNACSGECNLISGNFSAGVTLEDPGTEYNTVSGNYIGTNVNGTAALPNNNNGVFIFEESSYNTIGGHTPGERNLISGNDFTGVVIGNVGTEYNVVRATISALTLRALLP